MPQIDELLKRMVEKEASDLHLTVGAYPLVRIHGELEKMDSLGIISESPLQSDQLRKLLYEILTEEQIQEFEERKELDFAYQAPGIGRFRTNIFEQLKGVGAAFRLIPNQILSLEELGLPKTLAKFTRLNKGLVLVTGPTGSGKSTTLASLIDLINRERKVHIITIEDPVEFVHVNKNSLINQRQLGSNTLSFSNALRAALREDPDVILIGEMRDLETISLAITAAETGHLVFGTLHTNSAAKTIDRIIDAFPSGQQAQIRTQLSESLKGVISQQLLKRADGKGRVVAIEILVGTPAIANLIREGKTYQIPSVIQTGRREGMQTMDQAIIDLLKMGKITTEEAFDKCVDRETFQKYLGRM
jgi:twitching motility protein PilT